MLRLLRRPRPLRPLALSCALLAAATAPATGDVLMLRPGGELEGDLVPGTRLLVRIETPGAYLVTSTPPLVPLPPLTFPAGDHEFRFDRPSGSEPRFVARCETVDRVADRLSSAAADGDRAAVLDADLLAERGGPAWQRVRARVHLAAGDEASARSDLGRAITHHRTARDLAEEFGVANVESAACRSLASLLAQIGELEAAVDAAARYRALEHATADPCAAAAADAWFGGYLAVLGLGERALEPLRAAEEAAARLGDPGLSAEVSMRLGDVHEQRGDAEAARAAFEQAIRGATLARSSEIAADAAIRLALLDRAAYRLDRAGALLRDLAADEETPEFQRLDAISSLARCHHLAGENAAARTVYEELTDRARRSGAPYFVTLGLQGSANALVRLGAYAEARARYLEALAASEQQGTDLRRNETLRALASLELQLGDVDRARAFIDESLELARTRGDVIEEVLALLVLATLEREAGDVAAASTHLDEAERRADGQPNLSAYAEVARIEHLLEVGDAAAARELAEASLLRLDGRRSRRGVRAVLPLLARASLLVGRTDAAADAAERALALAAVEDVDARLAPLEVLAAVALEAQDLAAAEASLAEAATLVDLLLGRGDLDVESATGLRSRHAGLAALRHDLTALAHAAGVQGAVERGFEAAGEWKGRGLLEGIAEHRRGGRTREITRLRRRIDDLQDRRRAVLERVFERTYRRGEDVTPLREEAERLRGEIDEAIERLARSSPRDAALERPPRGATVEQVRAGLAPGDRLVEFVEGRERLYAFVIEETSLAFEDLGDLDTTKTLVARHLEGLADPTRLSPAERVAATGRALAERLLARALLGGPPRRLIVVPSLSLGVLPFETLVLGAPEKASSFEDVVFLDDRTLVSYAPSSPVLVALAAAPARGEDGRLVVLADPLYGATAGSTGPPRLEQTRGEARALVGLRVGEDDAARGALDALMQLRSGSYRDDRVALHLGADASRARLSEPLRDARILHLAAHGVVRRDVPRASGLLLSGEDGRPDLFSIEDALALDLDAELVVLSACSTAQGRPRRGEGLESLARAFLHAGARAVVASLWDVSDAAAVETMRRFYRELLVSGRTPAAALREARRAMRRRTVEAGATRGVGGVRGAAERVPPGHPFLWAPFIHVGAPGPDDG